MSSHFFLEVERIEQFCTFKLSWGKGQRLTARVPYPETLTTFYRNWQATYLRFYNSALRARVDQSGVGVLPPIDWRTKLVQAEASLLAEFYFWLSDAKLLPIRSAIARAAAGEPNDAVVNVFLTCEPIEVARFPWEAWEIGTEFGSSKTIRIARTPANIREEAAQRDFRRRIRILAILGDETGLNFQKDREAVRSLAAIAEIEFVGWQPGKSGTDLKAEISRTIADENGWDILFFAGHSNETVLTGGELAIAPDESILIQEIAPQLAVAKARGLQFAIFNSCNGLSIADALIDLGLSQVAVMREPIHNLVAQEFLLRFVQSLAEYKDVHEALLVACQSLKLEKNLTYPSAHLIPSLFRHPEAELFRPKRVGIWQTLRKWLPQNRLEAIALSSLLLCSLLPPVQDLLMETRIGVQALCRQITRQIPPSNSPPPVLLVQIDQPSVYRYPLDARKINPLDRTYLAKLLTQVQQIQPRVIGIDYILDSPTAEDGALQQAIREAVAQKTWLVFAAEEVAGQETTGIHPSIASLNQVLKGYANAFPWYLELLPADRSCHESCPFAYLLALAHTLNHQPSTTNLPQPTRDNLHNLRSQVVDYLAQQPPMTQSLRFVQNARLSPMTTASEVVWQEWLRPILDFSIPPEQVYQRVSAYQILDGSWKAAANLPDSPSIVLIAQGGYDQAGVNQPGQDNFAVPMAIAHWRGQQANSPNNRWFTGAEAHAYMVHHLLKQRLVVPIPDLWMIGLAAIAGRGIGLLLRSKRRQRVGAMGCIMATTVYGLVSLQLYVVPGIVLPWLLPSAMFWAYVLPTVRRKPDAFS
jgi:CHASE2 domain-containing sensor protein